MIACVRSLASSARASERERKSMSERSAASERPGAHSANDAMCARQSSLAKVHLNTHTLVVASTRRAHEERRACEGRVLAFQRLGECGRAQPKLAGLAKARQPAESGQLPLGWRAGVVLRWPADARPTCAMNSG